MLSAGVVLMLAHRLRRWSNIKTTPAECLVCFWDALSYMGCVIIHVIYLLCRPIPVRDSVIHISIHVSLVLLNSWIPHYLG